MIQISVPMRIESQNTFNNKRGFGAQFKYKEYKQNWEKFLYEEFKNDKFEKVKEMRTVIIISVRSRELDFGNFVGGAKPVLDILQDLNILYNDSPKWLRDYYFQEIDRKKEKTIIIIF